MKSRIFMSMLVLALAAAMVGGATMAWFSDEAVVENNLFQAGTLGIDITDPAGVVFDFDNMAPSDVESGSITVENTGTLDMKFKALVNETKNELGDGSGDLADAIDVVVTLDNVNGSSRSDIVYSGSLRDLIDDPELMEKWDDNYVDRAFSEGYEATFEYEFTFDENAGNEYQNAQWEGNIVFVATQWTNDGWDE